MLKGKTKVSMDSFLKTTEVMALLHETLNINLGKWDETLQLSDIADCTCSLIVSIRVTFVKVKLRKYPIK